MKKLKNLVPKYATHGGNILLDELRARGIKQSVFCRKYGFSTTIINEIIKGKRSITAKTAIQLEAALCINAEFWMRIQAMYELDKERIRQHKHFYFKSKKINCA